MTLAQSLGNYRGSSTQLAHVVVEVERSGGPFCVSFQRCLKRIKRFNSVGSMTSPSLDLTVCQQAI